VAVGRNGYAVGVLIHHQVNLIRDLPGILFVPRPHSFAESCTHDLTRSHRHIAKAVAHGNARTRANLLSGYWRIGKSEGLAYNRISNAAQNTREFERGKQ